MAQRKSHDPAPVAVGLWQVPVAIENIGETGQHFDLAAEAPVRAAIAKVAGLRELPRLEANFDVTPRGAGGLHVSGRVSATVGQTCVVTLEPLTNEIDETINLVFLPRPQVPHSDAEPVQAGAEDAPRDVKWDDPEPLVDGLVDLGALATEFLILGLDPYPRKAGAVFQPPQDLKPDKGPFAALAKLKGHGDGS